MTKLPRIFHGKDILALQKRYEWKEGLPQSLAFAVIMTVPVFGYWVEADSLLFKKVSAREIYCISKEFILRYLSDLKVSFQKHD